LTTWYTLHRDINAIAFTFFSTYFRFGFLDIILSFMEELSAIHIVSEVMMADESSG
jgi:hypothetical protein